MTRIHNESVWTTTVTIQIEDEIDESVWHQLIQESVTFLHDVDRVFSPYKSDSYLNLVADENTSLELQHFEKPAHYKMYSPYISNGFTNSAHNAFEIVERFCVAAQWQSNGAFNAWRNETYDPIGLVKGWAADFVIEILKSYDINQAFVNAGGDIACISQTEPWRIAIGNPLDHMTAIGYLELERGALCTSGTYEKGNHIQTRNSQNDFSSVTISGPSAALADAFATGAIADGLAAFEWIGALGPDWGAIAMNADCSEIYLHNWRLEDQKFSRM
jgi:thiamine biosynthesis lipoprotein